MKKLILVLFLCPSIVFGAVTLNPSDKSTNLTLSGGNLTASSNGSWQSVRANISKTSGKWYFEVIANGTPSPYTSAVGWANSTFGLDWLGSTLNSWGYHSQFGTMYHNGSGSNNATWTTGDIIGVALDLTGGTIAVYKNGTLQGVQFSSVSTSTALYPAISFLSGTGSLTARFLDTSFTYSPPSGYSALETTAGTSTPSDFGNYATGTALTSGDTTITFQLAVIIFILFLMVVGMFHNNLFKRQAWR